MQADQPARYEFRIFGDDLTELARIIAACALDGSRDEGDQTYIASRLTIDASVKLRNGRLEVKRLKAREGLLELWEPAHVHKFPIKGHELADAALAELGANVDIPRDADVDSARMIEVCKAQPSLSIVNISKSRDRFSLGEGSFGEHARISIGGALLDSVAVESSDHVVANTLVKKFGLQPFVNESYPAMLQRLAFQGM